MTLIAGRQPARCGWSSRPPTDYWNDSCAIAELAYAVERGATGATSNPVIVGEVMKKEQDALGAARPRDRGRAPDLVGGRDHLGADRGDGRPRRRDPRAGLRARGRPQGPPLAPDEPGQLPRPGPDDRAGRSTSARSPPTSRSSSRRRPPASQAHRGGHGPGRRHQRDGRVHRGPGDRRRRGGRSRPPPVRGGRRRHEPVQPGLLAPDRTARRLGEGPRRARRHRPPPRCRELGRDRGVQAGLRASTRSAASGPACSPRPTATGSTGPSSSAATSC